MRRFWWFLILVVSTVATAQEAAVPRAKGTITVDTAPTGSCDSALYSRQFRKVASSGDEYTCVGGTWTLVKGKLQGERLLITVGPGDLNHDGTLDSKRYDYNCAAYSGTSGFTGSCIEQAIAAVPSSSSDRYEIRIAAGTYYLGDVNITNKTNLTITGAGMDSTWLTTDGTALGDSVFTLVDPFDEITFQDMSSGSADKQDGSDHAAFVAYYAASSDHTTTPTIYLNRIKFTNGGDGGLIYTTGSETYPGPRWIVNSVTCISSHYCLDINGNADVDSDGTVAEYSTVISNASQWITEGGHVEPQSAWGGSMIWYSQGDYFQADCKPVSSLYRTAPISAALRGHRRVFITGANFHIGAPLNPALSRANCNALGSSQIVSLLTIGDNWSVSDISEDSSLDEFVIANSSVYIQRYAGVTTSLVRHRGINSIPRFENLHVYVDDTTGFKLIDQTQGGVAEFNNVSVNAIGTDVSEYWTGSVIDRSTRRWHIADFADGNYIWHKLYDNKLYDVSGGLALGVKTSTSATSVVDLEFSETPVWNAVDDTKTTGLHFTTDKFRVGQNRSDIGAYITVDPFDYQIEVYPADTSDSAAPVVATLGKADRRWTNIYTATIDATSPIKLTPTDSPGTCDAAAKGSIYPDLSTNSLCYCNGTSWVKVDGGGAC